MSISSHHQAVIALSDFSLSLLSSGRGEETEPSLRLRVEAERSHRMTAVLTNQVVVAVLDVQLVVHLYTWSDLAGEELVCQPVSAVTLSTLPGPFGLAPCLALTDKALFSAEKGSNRLEKLSVCHHRLA